MSIVIREAGVVVILATLSLLCRVSLKKDEIIAIQLLRIDAGCRLERVKRYNHAFSLVRNNDLLSPSEINSMT